MNARHANNKCYDNLSSISSEVCFKDLSILLHTACRGMCGTKHRKKWQQSLNTYNWWLTTHSRCQLLESFADTNPSCRAIRNQWARSKKTSKLNSINKFIVFALANQANVSKLIRSLATLSNLHKMHKIYKDGCCWISRDWQGSPFLARAIELKIFQIILSWKVCIKRYDLAKIKTPSLERKLMVRL